MNGALVRNDRKRAFCSRTPHSLRSLRPPRPLFSGRPETKEEEMLL
ncbi:hypothetical protein BACCAP_04133 [Pseudoflavonifractor capillosus ATCC 29799]|uniref:Uncharacterized protein n=1 Tax=Pseudoflavonifractor capillosus ATCC 29799 TaxID=411467 RepID=A6P0W7_9FIRM|nr:hypothetical protein BACCAP_04133 [Pseudoflavonifractor capillosus ATCC 29799]